MKKAKKKLTGEPCSKCGDPTADKIMTIIDGPCHDCGAKMKIAFISSSELGWVRGHMRLPASEFNTEEIETAKAKGVILQMHYSKTKDQNYLANTCGNCGNFSGDHFLIEDYIVPASYGHLQSQEFNIGPICESCEA